MKFNDTKWELHALLPLFHWIISDLPADIFQCFFFRLMLESLDHAELGLSSTDNTVDLGTFRQSIDKILPSAKLVPYTIKNELSKR